MELWIPITIGAAFFQNLRTALQKHLKQRLDTTGATYARFFYALPFAWLYLAILSETAPTGIPAIAPDFALYAIVGGTAQILATLLLVWLFGRRHFAVGTSLSKTQTVQAALFGLVLLGDQLSAFDLTGIAISLLGVLMLSFQASLRHFLRGASWDGGSVVAGLAAGGLFAVASIAYRAAALSLAEGDFALRAACTLAWVTSFQTLAMGLYLAWRKRQVFANVIRAWRSASLVGITGMLGSAGWFSAMALENAARVQALGQIELVFTWLAGLLLFKERLNRKEGIGVILIVIGILALIQS